MKKVYIIAEAGVNHNGNMETAKELIDVASDAGADAVKFQTFKAENIVSKSAVKAEYQKKTTDATESQREMIRNLELSRENHIELINYCETKNITFLSTPFDIESVDLLVELGLNILKIPSGEITNLPLLRKIGSLNKQIIISTGMSNLGEIESALNVLVESGTEKESITVLHCNTEYPTPFEDVNLKAMITIKNAFKVKTGYSDHTLGIEIPIAAVALGAQIIEKHFTLDKKMAGPDHRASLEPDELKQMVKSIRNIENAIGDGIKVPGESEKKNINIARKSIVASKNVKKGDIFSSENVTVKRPGNGLSPMMWDFVIGRKAKKDFKEDEFIEI